MKRLFALLAVVSLSAAGCCIPEQNAEATNACKAEADSDACSACCKKNGANGHVYNGSECSCIGL